MGNEPIAARSGLMAKCACAFALFAVCVMAKASDTHDAQYTLHNRQSATFAEKVSLNETLRPDTTEISSEVPEIPPFVEELPVEVKDEQPTQEEQDVLGKKSKAKPNYAKERERELTDSLKHVRDSLNAAKKAKKDFERMKQQALKDSLKDVRKQQQAAADTLKADKKAKKAKEKADKKEEARRKDDSMMEIMVDGKVKRVKKKTTTWKDVELVEDSLLDTLKAKYREERKFKHKMLKSEAKMHDMPSGTYRRWLKFFTDFQRGKDYIEACDRLDTVDTYRETMILDGRTLLKMERDGDFLKLTNRKTDLKTQILLNSMLLKKEEERNKAIERSISAYVKIKNDIDSIGEIALNNDIEYLSRKYPDRVTVDWAYKRDAQRKKRVWKEINQRVRQGLDIDGVVFDSNEMQKIWRKDSVLNIWRDSLGAKNFFQRFSFHTNGLAWLMAVPNIGIEFDLSGKPSNRFSIIARAYFKPNMNRYHSNPALNYNVRSGSVEVRKYWRFGQIQDVTRQDHDMRTWEVKYNNGYKRLHHKERDDVKDTVDCPVDPMTGKKQPRIVRKGVTVEEAQYRTTVYLGDEYHWTAKVGEKDSLRGGKKSKENIVTLEQRKFVNADGTERTDTTFNIWTDKGELYKRLWEPFRYNTLSHRFVGNNRAKNPIRTDIRYYVGAMMGIEQYHWVLGSKGRQGKTAFGCVTAGLVVPLRLGTAFDIDFGAAVGMQMTTYYNFRYNSETNCYDFRNRVWSKLTPHPVIKELHVSLVYSLNSSENKTHNLFLTDEFQLKLDRVKWHNELAKNRSVRNAQKKRRLKVQKEINRWLKYKQFCNKYDWEQAEKEIKYILDNELNVDFFDSYDEAFAAAEKLYEQRNKQGKKDEKRAENESYILPANTGVIAPVDQDEL